MFWLPGPASVRSSLRILGRSSLVPYLSTATGFIAKGYEQCFFSSFLWSFKEPARMGVSASRSFATQAPFRFDVAKRICPHPSKVNKGGEDAAFSNDKYLGVADGVGSWIEVGVDPGFYSRELLYRVQRELGLPVKPSDMGDYHGPSLERLVTDSSVQHAFSSCSNVDRASRDPLAVLQAAFEKTRSQGSSTCCLVFLDPKTHTAKTLNLGDSGCILVRSPGEVVFRSEMQQHGHNFPFQLGPMSSDRPSDAKVEEIPLERGDWIVVATDGVWDNMHEQQIVDILATVSLPAHAAREIGEQAVQYSLDDHWNSPFSEKERMYQLDMVMRSMLKSNERFVDYEESVDTNLRRAVASGLTPRLVRAISGIRGGKSDDVSVVVARVT